MKEEGRSLERLVKNRVPIRGCAPHYPFYADFSNLHVADWDGAVALYSVMCSASHLMERRYFETPDGYQWRKHYHSI